MTAAHLNPVTVLGFLGRGQATTQDVADHFGVDRGNEFLRRTLGDLEHHGHIVWNRKTGEVKLS